MTTVVRNDRGQALVEFCLAFTVFALLLFGVIDFGRAIYQYNGVSQAAREIARVASVHPGSTFGTSPEIAAVTAVQKGLVPNLSNPVITCVDAAGAPAAPCNFGTDSVKVVVTAPFRGATPVISSLGAWTMSGSATFQIQ